MTQLASQEVRNVSFYISSRSSLSQEDMQEYMEGSVTNHHPGSETDTVEWVSTVWLANIRALGQPPSNMD